MMELKFRDGELSYKQFTQLTKSDKQEYLMLLTSMDKEFISYNDYYILNNYTKKEEVVNTKFLEL